MSYDSWKSEASDCKNFHKLAEKRGAPEKGHAPQIENIRYLVCVTKDFFLQGLAHYTSKGELEFNKDTKEQKSASDPTAPIERPKVVLKGK